MQKIHRVSRLFCPARVVLFRCRKKTNRKDFHMANYVVLDTETAPTVHYADGRAHAETSLVYDFGYTIFDVATNTTLCERSFVVAETFYNSALMNSAYYAAKIPTYQQGIKTGEWIVASFVEIWRTFKADCKAFNVKKAWAFNCAFDEKALNNTIKTYSNGFNQWFMPYKLRLCDIWDYSSNITCTANYLKFCDTNGKFTKTGNPSTCAETIFAFINNERDYEEKHTALEDARIEREILVTARKKHKKTRHSRGQGYRDAQKAYKNR